MQGAAHGRHLVGRSLPPEPQLCQILLAEGLVFLRQKLPQVGQADAGLESLALASRFLQVIQALLAGGASRQGRVAPQDALAGQGEFPAVLGEDVQALPFQFQDHPAQDPFFLKEFD